MGAPVGEKWKNKYAFVCHVLRFFSGYGFLRIGLKPPGSYSDQFWLDKISIFVCEGPTPPNSTVS